MHVREQGRGKSKERRSRERNKGWPADEQGARTGEGTRRADGEHNTAPRHQRGEHPRTKGRAAPRTTTRTAQTPHTPHTPNEPRQPAQQWAGSRRGTAPDPRRPSKWWKAPPPGTPFRHPHGEHRRPARAHAVGPVLGPHARTDRARDTRVAEPWLPAPEDGRPGEGQRLTPGAPHNGGRHPPRGRPSADPTASNAGPQGRTLWGRCWVHTPASTAPGTHGSRNPGCSLQRTGGRGRDSA